MLVANKLTKSLLIHASATSIDEYAGQESAESIRRFVEAKNREYDSLDERSERVEYDGKILRCVTADVAEIKEQLTRHEVELSSIDPLCSGAPDPGLLASIADGVLWWYDLDHMAASYASIKSQVIEIVPNGRERLTNVPVVIGGDWQFNAWACPAEHHGDFIMVHFGFMHAYSYAAMFLEMLDECADAAEKGQASGIITSSMIWMAATALGYEPHQWDNLRLPSSEWDRIWDTVQHPPDRLKQAIGTLDAFTMLHECGHIVCGHTDRLRDWLSDENPSHQMRLDRLRQMQSMEFEADRFACQSLCSQGQASRDCLDAILILFSMLRLCEDARSPLTSLTSTHPCATDRYRRCRSFFADGRAYDSDLLETIVRGIVDTSKNRIAWQEAQRTSAKPPPQ